MSISPPTNITLSSLTCQGAIVTWTNAVDISSYLCQIYESSSSDMSSPIIVAQLPSSTTEVTSGQVFEFVPTNNNYYAAIVTSVFEESQGASSMSTGVQHVASIQNPTGVTLSSLTGSGASVSWTSTDPCATVFDCKIYKADTEAELNDKDATLVVEELGVSTTTQNISFTSVANKWYAAAVIAKDDDGVSSEEIFSSGTQYIAPPGAPTSITLSALTATGMTVAWTAGSGATSYTCQIYSSAAANMQTSRNLVSPQDPANNASVTSPQAFLFTATDGLYYGAIVTAVNAAGSTASSTVSNFTGILYTAPSEVPGAPTGVTVDSISSTTIVISWTAPSTGGAVVSYNGAIFESTTSGGITGGSGTSIATATGITSGHSFTITAVSGRYYGAVITAVNANGSTASVIADITPVVYTAPPVAPTTVTLSSLTGSGASVSWSGGSGASTFTCQVYQSDASDMSSKTTVISQSPANDATVTTPQAFTFTVVSGKYYGAIVTAVNAGGSTASSVSAGVLYTAPPVAPTTVTLSSLTGSGASVAWSGGSGASTFTCQVYQSDASDMSSPSTVISQSPSNSTTVTTPQAFTFTVVSGKYYGAIVTAVNAGGSTASSVSTGVLYTAPPVAPTTVTLSSLTGSGASVSWSGGSGASTYTCQVYQSDASDMSSKTTVISQSPSNSTTVTTPQAFTFTVVSGKYYGAIVTAVNAGGSTASSVSAGVLYTAPSEAPGAPTGVTVDSITSTTIVISWTAPSTGGAVESYDGEIFKSSTSGGITGGSGTSVTTATGITSAHSFTITADDGYYYGAVITAVNTAGTTASVIADITPVVYTAPPGQATATTPTNTGSTLNMSWTAPASGGSVTGYIVSVLAAGSLAPEGTLTLGNVTSTTFSPMVSGTAYSFYVVATGPGGNGTASTTTSTVTYTAPPNAPTSITLSALTATGMTVAWTAGSGATSYTCQIYSSSTEDMQTSRNLVSPQNPANNSSVTSPQAFLFTAVDDLYYGAIVTAVNAGGSTASSTVSNFTGILYTAPTEAPGAPTGVTVDSITSTTIVISWTAPSTGGAVESYDGEIFKSSTSGGITGGSGTSVTTATGITSAHSFTITADDGYYYGAVITAVNTAGTTASVIANITPVLYTAPPVAPTTVTLSSLTGSGASVAWSGGSGASTYTCQVYQSDASDMSSKTTVISQSPSNSTTVTTPQAFTFTVVSGKYYGAIITAVNAGGSTASSVSAGVLYTAPPVAPTTVTLSSLTGSGASVSWSGGSGASTYTCQVYQSDASDMSSKTTVISQSPSNSTTVTTPQAFTFTVVSGKYYGAIVTAVNAGGSTASSVSAGVLYTAPPNAPTSITLSALTATGMTVAWTAGSGATSYTCQIYSSAAANMQTSRNLVSPQDPANNASVTSPQAFLFTATDGLYYGAIVTAVNVGGSTASSTVSNFTGILYTAPTDPPTAPTTITLSSLTGSGATVSWSGGSGATSYTCQLFYSSSSDMSSPTTVTQTPSSSTSVTSPRGFTFTSIDAKYYGAKVTAINDAGSQQSSMSAGVLYTESIICFKEDTKILCKINNTEEYIPIQDLRKGDLVKTSLNGFKSIDMIGWQDINHSISETRIPNQLYVCSKENFPEATEDLIITGAHSILVDFITDTHREKIDVVLGKIYITGDKYRLPACIDERTRIYEKEGKTTIYHFALENENYYMNYGIYANGILVETSSKRYLKEMSRMTLIE